MRRCVACIVKQSEGFTIDTEDICEDGTPCEDPTHSPPETA